MASRFATKTIPITRMDCPTCIPVLEREIKRLKGVDEIQGNYMNKTLKVTYDPEKVQLEEIEGAIERVGYRISYKKYPGVISRMMGRLRGEKIEEIISITDIDFPGKVLHASKPVVVIFSSSTCPACHFFKRQFEEIVDKVKGKVDLYEMNITSTETWRKYDILSIPTVLIFRKGKLSERFEALPKGEDIASALGVKSV
jgi:copper chaperone CopZ